MAYQNRYLQELFACLGDGTCEGVVCDYNAHCVALDNSVDPGKECRCNAGYTGEGDICTGELTMLAQCS